MTKKSESKLKSTKKLSKKKDLKKKVTTKAKISKKKASPKKKKVESLVLSKTTPFTANKFHDLEKGSDQTKQEIPDSAKSMQTETNSHHISKEELIQKLVKNWTKESPKVKKRKHSKK